MRRSFRIYLSAIFFMQCNLSSIICQIGINTDNPHPSSILHINSGNRGLLIPSMSSGDLISSPADGLLIYNSNSKMFDFYNKTLAKWQPISPFINESNLYTLNLNLKLNNPVLVNNTLTLNSKVYVKDTLSEIRGYGTIPIGGIIMWSGTNIPYGWALCDGRITPEGITTPDLRGRFIVGAGINSIGLSDPAIWDGGYLAPGNLSSKGILKGNTGGKKLTTLSINDLPVHSHSINLPTSSAGEHIHPYITAEADGNFSPYLRAGVKGAIMNHVGGYYVTYDSLTRQTKQIDLPRAITGNQMDAVPNHSHLVSGSTNNAGLGGTFENRPPYYVLAFIMRVK